MARLHVFVTGIVQGVFFRESTRTAARDLGLAGWVKNLPDGSVEAVFQGESEACRQALEFVSVGPPAARVSGVEEHWEDDTEALNGFELRF